MSVWVVCPSIREDGGTLREWKRAGYRVAVVRQGAPLDYPDFRVMVDEYRGWAKSINRLISDILVWGETKGQYGLNMEAAQWFVAGGDDVLPDPDHTPEVIEAQLTEHFGGTFGVMQPIGDLKDWPASRIDKFAGSAWIGREFARRMYGGEGPLFEGHFHCWADEELMEVATKLGVFWHRPDLTHKHLHQMRPGGLLLPPGVWEATAGRDYHQGRAQFEQRKAAGWPGHEPIP